MSVAPVARDTAHRTARTKILPIAYRATWTITPAGPAKHYVLLSDLGGVDQKNCPTHKATKTLGNDPSNTNWQARKTQNPSAYTRPHLPSPPAGNNNIDSNTKYTTSLITPPCTRLSLPTPRSPLQSPAHPLALQDDTHDTPPYIAQ
ncbi:hypothetical protein EW146_g8820 [Bondarzewia mesenterica]|uniref:Uncharacterized protein n=1 Tax=Bondarzewia mesenterica TaxID=1095465 RepID=A0A4V3XD97_9AGAM|nr:hypothetical protein EW146_g8820 [Bondarzewia mesenterica]